MTDAPRDSPGIYFPPPLIYALGFGGGYLLDQGRPVALLPETWRSLGLALGAVFVVGGFLLMFTGLLTFLRMKTAVVPHRSASTLVERGPYRFTRNPMYVGLTAAYLGGALYTNMAWYLLFLPLVLMVMNLYVIRREERYLEASFGEDYREYCKRVRRWL